MTREPIIERAGPYRWENIPEDAVMSRVSVHVYCAYRGRYGKEWARGAIRNHYDRLYFVEAGEAVVGTPEGKIQLRPGCCYLIPSDQVHDHACSSTITLHWCHFQAMLEGLSDLFQEMAVPTEARPRDPRRYRATFEALEATMACRQPRCHLQRAALLLQLIQPHLELAGRAPAELAETRRRFQPVLRHLDEHLDQEVRIEELAALVGLNREYFSRAFARYFHMPPKKYLLRKRIRMAQKLLCHTELRIQEVGARCGFPDPYHFSKTFRHIAGLPPTGYRNIYRQAATPDAPP